MSDGQSKKRGDTTATHPLIGRWFHTFHEDGGRPRVRYQGSVLATADNGVLVQLYEWITGAPSNEQWFSWTAVESWEFYPSAEAMNDAYTSKYQRCE